MTHRTVQHWLWVHKWSSLVCTIFLLMTCITGLPLIFRDEIGDWLDTDPPYAEFPADTPAVSLDALVAQSRAMYPGQIVTSIFIDDDEPKVLVSMAPSWEQLKADRKSGHWIKFDSRTAAVLKESMPIDARDAPFTATIMSIMLRLHKELFAGLPGELFLGLMGLLFVVAIISGVAIYDPFTRKLEFATIRTARSRRIKWLDFHNLIGIVTAVWTIVVGLTGVINELSTPLTGLWLLTDVKPALEAFKGEALPAPEDLTSPQEAIDLARTAAPGMIVTRVTFPGAEYGTPWHYVVILKGAAALSSRLLSFAVIDARDATFHSIVQMPWYLRVLEVSRPLHFGDYGGMPLKIIWALLDVVTIIILGSGLYLWWTKRQPLIDTTGNALPRGALRIEHRKQSEAAE